MVRTVGSWELRNGFGGCRGHRVVSFLDQRKCLLFGYQRALECSDGGSNSNDRLKGLIREEPKSSLLISDYHFRALGGKFRLENGNKSMASLHKKRQQNQIKR